MPDDLKPFTFKKQLRGGADTVREPANIQTGGFSMIQNMRQLHPGMRQRGGQSRLHTTAESVNPVTLFQFSKGGKVERHLFAQMDDGSVMEAVSNPPVVRTGAFASGNVFAGASGQIPASWSVTDDILLYSNGVNSHQIYVGQARPVEQFIVYRGTGTIPAIPTIGEDYSAEVQDDDTSTVAPLDSLGDLASGYDCIFIRTTVPANKFTFTVQAANGTAAVLRLNGWIGSWSPLSISDGTDVAGATIAQSGAITFTAASDIIPHYMFGNSGFWYQFYLDAGGALDAEVELSAVTYESPWQDIVNVWDGVLVDAIEAQVFINASTVYQVYGSSAVTVGGLTSSDKIYFSSPDPIVAFYVDPGATPNTTASTVINSVTTFNGTAFASVGAIADGSNGIANAGWVTFGRHTAHKTQLNKGQYYAYWYCFTVDKTLSASIVIGIKTMPWFDLTELGAGICNCGWKDRALYVFEKTPNYIHVSGQNQPMALNGSDFTILQAGDGRKNKIAAMRTFYNELMVWQEEKGRNGGCLTLFEGYSPATFGKLVLSTRIGTMNAKCVAVVDGVMTSTRTDDKIKVLAFTLSRYGVFMCDGTVVAAVDDAIHNYFDPSKTECIRAGYEAKMWLDYDSAHNVIRIGLVSGGAATTCNVFPVLDLIDMTWSFDVLGQQLSCITEVEAASGDIPILQVGGGQADGRVYRLNNTSDDVTTAIDAFATLEIDGDGDIITIRDIVTRIKAGEGTCTITVYADGTLSSTKTVP